MSSFQIWGVIFGMASVTFACRSFFLFTKSQLPIPTWILGGLRFAPAAALIAIVAPEILLVNGQFISSWFDAKLLGTITGIAYFAWRRTVMGTIVCGVSVMLLSRAVWPV